MNDHSTGCLVILLEGRIIGIITVQDLVYRVVAKGLNPQKMRVQEIASKSVVVMRPETSLVTAVKVMLARAFANFLEEILLTVPALSLKEDLVVVLDG